MIGDVCVRVASDVLDGWNAGYAEQVVEAAAEAAQRAGGDLLTDEPPTFTFDDDGADVMFKMRRRTQA